MRRPCVLKMLLVTLFCTPISALALRGGARAKKAPEKEQKSLQWLQAGAALCAREWPAVAPGIGGGLATLARRCEVRPSPFHGDGLFAAEDLPAGTLATLYAPDLTVDASGDGFALDADMEASGRRLHWVYPPGLVTSAVPAGSERFHVSANPARRDAGWLGHVANDGAALSAADDDAVLRYLVASRARRNGCFVPLCVPLMGLVLTEDVAAGDEILVTFGYDSWLGTGLRSDHRSDIADALREDAAEYVAMTLLAAENYGREFAALAHFLGTGNIVEHAPPPTAKRPKKKKRGFAGNR